MKKSKSENIIRNLLASSAWVMVNIRLAKEVGLPAAIMIAYLSDKGEYYSSQGLVDDDGYFYHTQESIREATTLSPYQQSQAISDLETAGLLDIKRKGIPRRNYFRINFEALTSIFQWPVLKKPMTGTQKTNDYNIRSNIKTENLLPEDKSSSRSTTAGAIVHKLHRRKLSRILHDDKKVAKKKAPVPIAIPAKVRSVFNYWEGKGLRIPREGTKAHRECVTKVRTLFEGKAFNHTEFDDYLKYKFTIKEIRKAIDRFALAALDPHHLPVSQYKKILRKMPIGQFIYSPFSSNGTGRSQFIHYLENEPKVSGTPVVALKDENPEVTNALRRYYVREVLGGADPKWTVMEQNHFIIGAEKLKKFLSKHRDRIKWYQPFTPRLMAGWVIEALKNQLDGNLSKVTPAWISSDTLYQRRLAAYLHTQALLSDEGERAGQTRVGFLH